MDSGHAIRKIQTAQAILAENVLLRLKIGSDEIASALHKYRAMATVIAEIEKADNDDDERLNKL